MPRVEHVDQETLMRATQVESDSRCPNARNPWHKVGSNTTVRGVARSVAAGIVGDEKPLLLPSNSGEEEL